MSLSERSRNGSFWWISSELLSTSEEWVDDLVDHLVDNLGDHLVDDLVDHLLGHLVDHGAYRHSDSVSDNGSP